MLSLILFLFSFFLEEAIQRGVLSRLLAQMIPFQAKCLEACGAQACMRVRWSHSMDVCRSVAHSCAAPLFIYFFLVAFLVTVNVREQLKVLVLQNRRPSASAAFFLSVRFVLCSHKKKRVKVYTAILQTSKHPTSSNRKKKYNYSHCGRGVNKTINNQEDKIKPAGQQTAMVLLKHASFTCSLRLSSC